MSFPADHMSGVAVIAADGTVTVVNKNATSDVCLSLTAQDGGTVPAGSMYVSARVAGASFTIASTAGAADAGTVVYWQVCR